MPITPTHAAQLLDLPADATPEQLEARFHELRTKLEEKIGKAPTPGLKAKYRESLDEITLAFETLTLAADSSALPVAHRQSPGGPVSAPAVSSHVGSPFAATSPGRSAQAPTLQPKPKSGGKEFILVAIIAVIVLAAGGWFVLKTRAENAEKARVAAEQQAAAVAEQKRQAEVAQLRETQRQQALTELRVRYAELNLQLDNLLEESDLAARQITELRSLEREALRESKGVASPAAKRAASRLLALEVYAEWLQATLPTHPAKFAKARIDELLQARDLEATPAAISDYGSAIERLALEIREGRDKTVVTGRVRIESAEPGVTWKLTDVHGGELNGEAPAQLRDVPAGRAVITLQRPRWPDQKINLTVERGAEAVVKAEFIPATLSVSAPDGATVSVQGRLPDADGQWRLEPGISTVVGEKPGDAPDVVRVQATPGAELKLTVRPHRDFYSASLKLALIRLPHIENDAAFASATADLAQRFRILKDPASVEEIARMALAREWRDPIKPHSLPFLGLQILAVRKNNYIPPLIELCDRLWAEGKMDESGEYGRYARPQAEKDRLMLWLAINRRDRADPLLPPAGEKRRETLMGIVSNLASQDVDAASDIRSSIEDANSYLFVGAIDRELLLQEIYRDLARRDESAAIEKLRRFYQRLVADLQRGGQKASLYLSQFVWIAESGRSAGNRRFVAETARLLEEYRANPNVVINAAGLTTDPKTVLDDAAYTNEVARRTAEAQTSIYAAWRLEDHSASVQALMKLNRELHSYRIPATAAP